MMIIYNKGHRFENRELPCIQHQHNFTYLWKEIENNKIDGRNKHIIFLTMQKRFEEPIQ